MLVYEALMQEKKFELFKLDFHSLIMTGKSAGLSDEMKSPEKKKNGIKDLISSGIFPVKKKKIKPANLPDTASSE